ncbi:methyltransferase [Streptomyces sp. SA15]|uniref:methyltransferase n=1 Tax=Streptomyces sp. SA15 TaxID=934019 RepID=UPI00211C1F52|nr:methyltransferase [Streptomyces sp. SA15]
MARDRRVHRHRTQQRQERRDQPRDQARRPQRVRLPQRRQPAAADTLRHHPPSPPGRVLDLQIRQAGRRGLSDRFSGVPGDFFHEVPSADLYLLKTVLHDWDDERCTTILRNCRSAAREGGRALVVEMLVDREIGKPDFATIADVTMLCVTGGIERDLDEFDALFAATYWRRGRTYPVGGGYHAMELEAI